jgi:hypothetical protein
VAGQGPDPGGLRRHPPPHGWPAGWASSSRP